MDAKQRRRRDKVLTGTYITGDFGKDELTNRLREVHEVLIEVEQGDKPPGLSTLAPKLVEPAMLEHKDKV